MHNKGKDVAGLMTTHNKKPILQPAATWFLCLDSTSKLQESREKPMMWAWRRSSLGIDSIVGFSYSIPWNVASSRRIGFLLILAEPDLIPGQHASFSKG
jgi:hypothetical protein